MAQEVRVESLERLEALEGQLAEFVHGLAEQVRSLNGSFQRAIAYAQEALQRQQMKVARLERELAQTDDEEEQARLERELERAMAHLSRLRRWHAQVEQAYAEYRRQEARVQALIAQEAPKARALLRRKIEDLRAYIALTLPGPFPAPGAAPSEGGTFSTTTWASDFFEIDPALVRVEGVDPNFEKTPHGYSRAQIEEWLHHLQTIQELRAQGYTDEDFQRMRHSQDPTEKALGNTYHKFYDHDLSDERGRMNQDFIVVDWVGDHYEVVNGRHRIWLAQQMGIRRIPALVRAPNRETLERLQSGSLEKSPDPEPGGSP
jgi:hypothetical protein